MNSTDWIDRTKDAVVAFLVTFTVRPKEMWN